ncbi:DUF2480 family protein [soil metagenome]
MDDVIINKVAESGLITLDLEKFFPKEDIMLFDLKDHLFMNLILKEKDFREALKKIDWSVYQNKNVALTCTEDAVIPVWAYMLVAAYLAPFANNVFMGGEKEMFSALFLKNIRANINREEFRDKRVVIKGCGEKFIPEAAYAEITGILQPVVKSIMYGEPCSTVPVYKKK